MQGNTAADIRPGNLTDAAANCYIETGSKQIKLHFEINKQGHGEDNGKLEYRRAVTDIQ
jgi:hypothetical protein